MTENKDELNKEKIDELATFLDFCADKLSEMQDTIRNPIFSTPVGVGAAFVNAREFVSYMDGRINEIKGTQND